MLCSRELAGRRRANEGMRAGRQPPRPLTRRLLSKRKAETHRGRSERVRPETRRAPLGNALEGEDAGPRYNRSHRRTPVRRMVLIRPGNDVRPLPGSRCRHAQARAGTAGRSLCRQFPRPRQHPLRAASVPGGEAGVWLATRISARGQGARESCQIVRTGTSSPVRGYGGRARPSRHRRSPRAQGLLALSARVPTAQGRARGGSFRSN
jgi:hypothetical protein